MAIRTDDLVVEVEVDSPAIGSSTLKWIAADFQRQGRTVRIGLALTTGVMWALAAPPRGWWPLLSLGVAFLTLALHGRGERERCLFGSLTGAVFYGLTLQWLIDFSVPGYLAMVLLETSLLAAVVALIPAPRSGRWAGGWWALPAALVLLEAVQLRFPLGGFPLPGLALSQPDGPFAMAAPLGGSLLVTALAATSGVALAALFVLPGRRRRLVAVGGAVSLILAPLIAGAAITTRTIATLDVAVVQGGGPRGVLADPTRVTARHLAVMQQIVGSTDLVVLPENVVDVDGSIAGSLPDSQIGAKARRLNTSVVVGIVEKSGDKFRNAAVLWEPDGGRLDRYEKEHRVPFGEYIPARRVLELVTDATTLVPRDAIPGEGKALLSAPVGPLGVVISYEVFFADRVRDAVTSGGQVVLVPTNAASYITPEVPALEVAAARLRAREFDRAVLQAAPTGYSATPERHGRRSEPTGRRDRAPRTHPSSNRPDSVRPRR